MNKKIISLIAAAALSVQSLVIPMVANAEAAVDKNDIYVQESDFSEVAAGGLPGMALIADNAPWLWKGSSSEHYETFMNNEKDGNYGNFKSTSDKNGTAGEGSWYWYHRSNSKHIVDKGFMKFDIRMNSGNIELNFGDFTDPTKGTTNLAGKVFFSSTGGQITASSSGGKTTRLCSMKAGEWYTVQIDINAKLQEYAVKVSDASGKEIGSAEEIAFVESACTEIKTQCFGYIRKENGHDFDLRNMTIARVAGDLIPPKAAEPAPEPSAEPTAAPSTEPTQAPSASPVAASKITLKIDDTAMVVNDTTTTLDVPAQIINDRTMVPLRAIFEALGANVDWDGATRTITGKKGDITVVMVVDATVMKVNDKEVTLDTPAQIVSDRTLVPARAISEALGAKVDWDGATRTVTITAE